MIPRARRGGGATMRRQRRLVTDGARFTADPGPPEPPKARLDRIRAKAPLLLALATEPIRQAKAAAEAAQLVRARRVGRDLGVVNRSDYGPGIRLVSIRGPGGTIVREADVEVVDTPDPDAPKVTRRRARRTDPLEVLKRAGTISARECEAGERLRDAIEQSQPSLPGVSRSEVHMAPRLVGPSGDMRPSRVCAIRQRLNCFAAVRAHWPITTNSRCRGPHRT